MRYREIPAAASTPGQTASFRSPTRCLLYFNLFHRFLRDHDHERNGLFLFEFAVDLTHVEVQKVRELRTEEDP